MALAGSAPWLAIAIYLVGAGSDVPGFVYGIFISLFMLFNCCAVTLKRRGTSRFDNPG